MLHGMSARTSSDQVQAVSQRIRMFQVEHVRRNLVTQGQYRENRGGRASGCSKHFAYGRQLTCLYFAQYQRRAARFVPSRMEFMATLGLVRVGRRW